MVAAGASLVNLVLDVLVGLIALDSGLREGVVVPPVNQGRTSSFPASTFAVWPLKRRFA